MKGNIMEKFTITRIPNIDINKGYNFQANIELHFGEIEKASDFTRDSVPYFMGSDLPSLNASVKSCNQATLCIIDNIHVKHDTIENMIDNFLKADKSSHYYIGLDLIDENVYSVIKLDKIEFKQLLMPYIYESVSSAKSNNEKLNLKLDLRSKKRQKAVWEI